MAWNTSQPATTFTRRQFGAVTTMAALGAAGAAKAAPASCPKIRKLGTIDIDLVERV